MVPSLVLEDGTVITQSHAIVRYLAREFNLYGKTNKDRVIIDQVLDTLKNVLESCTGAYFFAKEPSVKVNIICLDCFYLFNFLFNFFSYGICFNLNNNIIIFYYFLFAINNLIPRAFLLFT